MTSLAVVRRDVSFALAGDFRSRRVEISAAAGSIGWEEVREVVDWKSACDAYA